jgi:hypothetical protein
MVRDQAADHEVDRHGWREIENVHHTIVDFVGILGDRLRKADGPQTSTVRRWCLQLRFWIGNGLADQSIRSGRCLE